MHSRHRGHRRQGTLALPAAHATIDRLPRTTDFHLAIFGGTKSLVLTTRSPVGNRNGVLGGAFMAVGGACLVAGLVVLSKFQATPRLVECAGKTRIALL